MAFQIMKTVGRAALCCAVPLLAAALPARAEDDSPRAALAAYEAAMAAQAAADATEQAAPAATEPVRSATTETQGKAAPRSRRVSGTTVPGDLSVLIARHAEAHAIPVGLAKGVILVESRFNPSARNGPYMGLTQVSVATARAMGYAGPPAGLLDPDTNLRFGLRYLAQAYRLAGGDTCRTILKYQRGHRAETMTSATRAYCARVKTTVAQRD